MVRLGIGPYNSPILQCLLLKIFFFLFIHLRSIGSSVSLLARERDSWDLVKGPCSVYALKGRRPKMEDRFSVLADEGSGIALYGIFDGHGGEVSNIQSLTLGLTKVRKLRRVKARW